MHRLAEVSFNSDQAFGTLATRLIRAGLIARDEGPGRVLTHRLTPAGEAALRAGRGPANRVVEASLSVLSVEEKDQLARLLAKALGGAGAASPSAPPSAPPSGPSSP